MILIWKKLEQIWQKFRLEKAKAEIQGVIADQTDLFQILIID